MEKVVILYRKLQQLVNQNMIQSDDVLDLLISIYAQCQDALSKCEEVSLISVVCVKFCKFDQA